MVIIIDIRNILTLCLCRASLEDRLKLEEYSGTSNMADSAVGSKQLTFTLQKVNFNVLINLKCTHCLQGGSTIFTRNLLIGKICLESHVTLLNGDTELLIKTLSCCHMKNI